MSNVPYIYLSSRLLHIKDEIIPYKQLYLLSCFYLNTVAKHFPSMVLRFLWKHHPRSLHDSPSHNDLEMNLDVQYLNCLFSTVEARTDHMLP